MEFKLIIKKLNNNLTREEESVFEKWYKESKLHKNYFDNVKANYQDDIHYIDVEKGWQAIESKIVVPKQKKNYWRYAVAASVALLISVYFVFNKDKAQVNQLIIVDNNIEIGTDKATLTLEDGTKITLGKGQNYKKDNLNSNGEELIYNIENNSKKDIAYNYLTIPRGGQFLLKLTDGTKIWLNSDSKIKYPKVFKEGSLRKVELVYGEAYFEVSPSVKHGGSKFKVTTNMQEVEVLGTEFNIKAYSDEDNIYTTLVKGKVTINNGYFKEFLEPDQQSTVNDVKQEINITQVDTYDITSWRRGIFSFKNTSLFEITKVLSRWYDVQFIYENKDLKNVKYNGVLDKKQNIKTILSILEVTNNINYEIKNKTIILK